MSAEVSSGDEESTEDTLSKQAEAPASAFADGPEEFPLELIEAPSANFRDGSIEEETLNELEEIVARRAGKSSKSRKLL